MFAGLILAAGASERLGSPKALLSVDGEPAIGRIARLIHEAGGRPIVAVLGSDSERVRIALPQSCGAVVNPDWPNGRTNSVRAGLRALPVASHVLLWPVDHPGVRAATVRTLVEGDERIRVPTHEGRRGHPTLFPPSLRDEILALRDDEPLHEILRRDPARVREVPVEDPGVLLNVNTPEDRARLDELTRRAKRANAPA